MRSTSIVTTLCNGKVIAKNTESITEAARQFVLMLRSGILGTDVRPIIEPGQAPNADLSYPLHVTRVSYLHGDLHTATRMHDITECSH